MEISNILNGMPTQDGAGVNLTRVIGQPKLRNLDPFLMLDEIKSTDPNDYIAGFPAHPHKGFETLSYMIRGSMEHSDSTGGHGLVTSGGVQYMTAGKGIIHSETPKQDAGLLFGFQLWLNLSAKDKLQEPKYEDIPSTKIPELDIALLSQGKPALQANATVQKNSTTSTESLKGRVKVIAGQFNQQGPVGPVIRDDIQADIFDISLKGKLELNIAIGKNAFVYVYEGQIELAGHMVSQNQIATLNHGDDSSVLTINAIHQSRFLLLAAKPIGEPIVQYGPFVMNKMSEIDVALQDYQAGRFV